MYEEGYCNMECDVKGCGLKLSVPVDERDCYGWEVQREVEGADGTTRKVCLCPEHSIAYHAARKAYTESIDKLLEGDAK